MLRILVKAKISLNLGSEIGTSPSADAHNPLKTKKWLPRMDSNHDKQIQNLQCYRYTTRQFICSIRTISGTVGQKSRKNPGGQHDLPAWLIQGIFCKVLA